MTEVVTKPTRHRPRVATCAGLVLFGSLLGFVLAEATYRGFLHHAQPEMFAQFADAHPSVFFLQRPVWQFHAEFGYTYVPGRRWQSGFVSEGILRGCDDKALTNPDGNMGAQRQPYHSAAVKLLVFGDSVTAQVGQGNMSYPDFLADQLVQETGRSVGVINLGRDGYGVLQMMDLARRKIPELKPHAALIVFITDDLTRNRFWRTSSMIGGRLRMLTTVEPKERPDPAKSTDTVILEEHATSEWCHRQIAHPNPHDPVLQRLEETARIVQRHVQHRPTLLVMSNSFLLEKAWYSDPFAFVYRNLPPPTNPRHTLANFMDDQRFAEAARDLRAVNTPLVLVHLAIHPELQAKQYALSRQQQALIASLSQALATPVYSGLEYSDLTRPDLDKMKIHPNDGAHPSLWGMKYHADALTRILKIAVPHAVAPPPRSSR